MADPKVLILVLSISKHWGSKSQPLKLPVSWKLQKHPQLPKKNCQPKTKTKSPAFAAFALPKKTKPKAPLWSLASSSFSRSKWSSPSRRSPNPRGSPGRSSAPPDVDKDEPPQMSSAFLRVTGCWFCWNFCFGFFLDVFLSGCWSFWWFQSGHIVKWLFSPAVSGWCILVFELQVIQNLLLHTLQGLCLEVLETKHPLMRQQSAYGSKALATLQFCWKSLQKCLVQYQNRNEKKKSRTESHAWLWIKIWSSKCFFLLKNIYLFPTSRSSAWLLPESSANRDVALNREEFFSSFFRWMEKMVLEFTQNRKS